jgi:hypothetical protein
MNFRVWIVAASFVLSSCATPPQPKSGESGTPPDDSVEATKIYGLQHRILPSLLFNSNGIFYVQLREGATERLKEAIANDLGPEYASGVTVSASSDAKIVFITFPRPKRTPHCYHVALVRIEGGFRYFTLERTEDLFSKGIKTCLCEWTDGMHRNYGPRDYTSLDKFESDVKQLLADEPAQNAAPATETD